jgi:hypothetical protein
MVQPMLKASDTLLKETVTAHPAHCTSSNALVLAVCFVRVGVHELLQLYIA